MTDDRHAGALPGGPLGRATAILRVADLDASLDYYECVLGFQVDWRAGMFASISCERASVMLSEGDQGQAGTWLWIACADADALYAEAGARGALLRHPPTNYPWGSRECQLADPDGHVLRFGADLRAGEPMGAWRDGAGVLWMPTVDGGWEREA